jgi:RNA polymerase sigma factor (TIGR02999 family)
VEAGTPGAYDEIMPRIYSELRLVAAGYLRRESHQGTLEPTALVHEAFLRLVGQRNVRWANRAHFYGIAAQMMRRVIVDYARERRAQKRGGGVEIVTLDDDVSATEDEHADVLRVDEALSRLAGINERQARVVELRFFGGLTVEEAAHVLGVSKATIDRDWLIARTWLRAELQDPP